MGLPHPHDKYDTESAGRLVTLGLEKVESVIPEILEWIQDVNWPVATVFIPFLVDAGASLAPFVQPIFSANDAIWTFNVLNVVVSQSPALARELSGELERLADNPTVSGQLEGVSDRAREILANSGRNTW